MIYSIEQYADHLRESISQAGIYHDSAHRVGELILVTIEMNVGLLL